MANKTSGLKEPHLLLASSNCQKLVNNLRHILTPSAIKLLAAEIDSNVRSLLLLGRTHLQFAASLNRTDHWRQQVSRLYYAAYNARRALDLHSSGIFSTDSGDHKRIAELPDDFPERNTYASRLTALRQDRNLSDYSHVATSNDLIEPPETTVEWVSRFVDECEAYLKNRGSLL